MERRATGTLTGNQYKTDAKKAPRVGFSTRRASTPSPPEPNLCDGGQTDENTRLGAIQLDIAEARYRAAEQQVLLETIDLSSVPVQTARLR